MLEKEVTARLTERQILALTDLAARRGTDANTVLQQAIETEMLIAENVGKDDTLQIKRNDNSISKVIFGTP